jgi:hypothetical protein
VTPIAGIPFCVTCQAHIVTNEVEAVTLQERYAGKTVQGKIMVAVSGPSPIPTSYSGGRSLRFPANKKNNPSINKGKNANSNNIRSGATEISEMRDEVSSQSVQCQQRGQPQQRQAQGSPALLSNADTIEKFRSESSLCAKQSSVPDRLTSPLSRPSISNMSSPQVGDKLRDTTSAQKRGNRLAPAFAIAHGGGEDIEIICAESTQWFSSEADDEVNGDDAGEDEEEVVTRVEEDYTEPKQQQQEEMTMFDEDDDEDSLKVMTSRDGPCVATWHITLLVAIRASVLVRVTR